jgi:Tfp pilus assembly PilM family ATPase/Tfp pilus assembly protein PilN
MRFRRFRRDAVVGVDLSPGRIKVVGLARGESGPVVVCAADEAFDGGSADSRTRFDAEAIGGRVAAILGRSGVRASTIALALGPGEAVARRLSVVAQDRAGTVAALSVQLGQALGADVTLPRVDFAPLAGGGSEGRAVVLAAAARAEAVGAQQRAVAAAGVTQGPVTAAAVALINAWRVCGPGTGRRVVLLHVGHSAALWIVLEDGEPVALDAPLVGAAAMRDRSGARGSGNADGVALREWTGRLRQEIDRGLQPLRRDRGEDAGADEVWVSGGGTRVPGFIDALSESLGTRVRLFDPFSAGVLSRELKDEIGYGPALVPALGAALQALADDSATAEPLFSLDLRVAAAGTRVASGLAPATIARSVLADRAFHVLLGAAALVWLGTAAVGARQRAAGRELDGRERRVEADSAAVAATMRRSSALEERQRRLGERVAAARRLAVGRSEWRSLLVEIARSVPASGWVSEVSSEAEDPATGALTCRVRGFAASDAEASTFARSLAARPRIASAEVVRTSAAKIGRTPVSRYEIQVRTRAQAGEEVVR